MSTELTQMPNEFCPAGCPCYVPDIKSSNFFRIDGSCDYSVAEKDHTEDTKEIMLRLLEKWERA